MRLVRYSVLLFALILFMAGAALPVENSAPVKLTLGEAVDIALQNNPAIADAESLQTEAFAAAERADSERRTQLRLDSRFTHLSKVQTLETAPNLPGVILGEDNTWLAGIEAQKVIYSSGRLEALVRKAAGTARAAAAKKTRVRQLVSFQAERAFRLVLAARSGTKVAKKALDAAKGHLKTAENRFQSRDAAKFDVIRAEVQVEEARQNLINAESVIKIANAELLQALGLEDGNFELVETGLSAYQKRPLGELICQARQNRPELIAVGWQEASSLAGIDAARGEKLPVVKLMADYQVVEPESPFLFNRWSMNVLFTLPILDGGRAKADLVLAKEKHNQIIASRESLLRQVETQVRQAYARLESAESEVLVAEKRIEQAEELLRLAEARYEGGVGTAIEVADAQTSHTAARQGLTRAMAKQGIAEAELRFAVGTTFEKAAPDQMEDYQ